MRFGALRRWWNRCWFTETSPSPICLFRIAYGLLVLTTGVLLGPDLLNWYGHGAAISQQTIHDWENSEARFSIFFLLPETNTVVVITYSVLMLAAASLTVGLFSRLSAFLVYVCLLSFQQRMACIFNAGDTILRHQALLLIFSSAGALYSIDSVRRNKSNKPSTASVLCSPWAQRLIQLQLAGVYCQTFFSKMACSQWIDGTALYYSSRLTDFARLPVPFLFDHLWTCQLLSWTTLAVELSLFTLIWFKRFRYPVIAIGTIFHLGIDWSMNIPVFEYIMIASYINFLQPNDVDRFVSSCKKWISAILSRYQGSTKQDSV
jgi:hypothetical protein